MNITACVVNYCTPQEIKLSVDSLKSFYPEINVIIIDGSPYKSEGWITCNELADKYELKVYHLAKNIGHGKGLNIAIGLTTTDYCLLFDSDIEVLKPCLKEMYYLLGNNYGIGQIVTVNEKGINTDKGIKYLHPYFCLINKKEYLKYSPLIHHGAPFLKSMIDIKGKGLIDFPVQNYVKHFGRKTRELNPVEFSSKNWDNI